ncbi:MAG: ABC transporter permease [Pseudonocardiales bacterium]
MNVLRLIARGWLLQVKMMSRSAFNGVLQIVWPLFFATITFLMYGSTNQRALVSAAVGASVLGIWSSTSTSGAAVIQRERRQGTLELLVAAPAPFAATILPVTLAMSTIGAYSMVATFVWGRLLFGISVPLAHPLLLPFAVVVTIVSVGMLGFLLSVAVVRFRSAWALGNMFEFPIWLVCGFLVPLSLLPGWVRPISWLLAPTWGVQAIRAAMLGGSPLPAIGLAALCGAAYAGIAIGLSERLVRAARRDATLALS